MEMQHWYKNGQCMLTQSGAYSVTQSYNAILGPQRRMEESDLIWSGVMQPKHIFIVWLANQNRLLTKDRLTRLNIPVNNLLCVLCTRDQPETPTHLFAECSWVSEVRNGLSYWTGFQFKQQGVSQSIRWFKIRHWSQLKKELLTAVWGAMIYYTWQARNWTAFRNRSANTSLVIRKIQRQMRDRLDVLSSSKKALHSQYLIQQLCN